jgi:hypothetical protein
LELFFDRDYSETEGLRIPEMESHEVISPMFADLSKIPIKDDSVIYDQYLQIPFNGNLASVDTVPRITFQNSDRSNWYDYSRAYVLVTGKVTKSDGTALGAADTAAVMNGGWNLFRRPGFKYGGQSLHVPEKDYCGQIANITGLLEYSEDYVRAGATSAGFYPDTADGTTGITGLSFNVAADAAVTGGTVGALMAQIAPKIIYNPELYNQGFAQRSVAAAGSALQSFVLPLRDIFGFLKDNHIAMRGELMELTLDRETNNARILHTVAGAAAGLKFQMTNIEMWVPQVKPKLALEAQLDLMTAEGFKTKLAYKDWRVYYLDNGTQTSVNWNPASVKNPQRIVFAMYDTTADTDQKVNAGVYKHSALTSFLVRLAGHQFPERPLKPDFASNSYGRVYHDMLELFGKSDPTFGVDHGSVINQKRFKDLYPFFAVDLSKRNSSINNVGDLLRLDLEGVVDNSAKSLVCLVETDEEFILEGVGKGVRVLP